MEIDNENGTSDYWNFLIQQDALYIWGIASWEYACYMLTTDTTVCPPQLNETFPTVRAPKASQNDFFRFMNALLSFLSHYGGSHGYWIFLQPNMSNPYFCYLDDVSSLIDDVILTNWNRQTDEYYTSSGAIELHQTSNLL